MITFHVIKMHSNKDTFPILLGRPWLRMSDAIVNWGGGGGSSRRRHGRGRVPREGSPASRDGC